VGARQQERERERERDNTECERFVRQCYKRNWDQLSLILIFKNSRDAHIKMVFYFH